MPDRDKADEYRELAERAKREAERATHADDQRSWHQLAAAWLRLLALLQPQPQLQQQPQQQLEPEQPDARKPDDRD